MFVMPKGKVLETVNQALNKMIIQLIYTNLIYNQFKNNNIDNNQNQRIVAKKIH